MRRPALLVFLYLLLSFVSFPGVDAGWVVWFSYVPVLLLLKYANRWRRFISLIFLTEMVKWSILVIWLRHVSWFAVLAVAAAFAAYHCIWFAIFRKCVGENSVDGVKRLRFWEILSLGLLWSAMEWIRTQPFGLPGAHLAITQWKFPVMLQISSWIGAYGLSGLIVIVNIQITQFLSRISHPEDRKSNQWLRPIFGGFAVITIVSVFGVLRLQQSPRDTKSYNIGVIQPYTPAYREWTFERMTETIGNVIRESIELVNREDIDFLVWPEGTLPGSIYTGSSMEFEVESLVDRYLKVPLLFGNQKEYDDKLYNAVLLCEPVDGIRDEFYAKRILVPFGEFIPGRRFLKQLGTLVPIPEDFQHGTSSVTLTIHLDSEDINISSQICYEDCFPELLLNDDLSETDLIFVATYNVWYGEEFGAYFHAAHSVLRAVENGRSVLRCGSGGWSGLIDEKGRIVDVVRSPDNGSIYFRGSQVVHWQPGGKQLTFYKRFHKLLHLLYLVLGLWIVFDSLARKRSHKQAHIEVI